MFTRRTMLRALGLGVPAAAVAAASLTKVAPLVEPASAVRTSLVFEAERLVLSSRREAPFNVDGLSAVDADMGHVTAGHILSKDRRIAFDPKSGFSFSA